MDRGQGGMLVLMLKRIVKPLVPTRNPWFPKNIRSGKYISCSLTNLIYTAHPLFFALTK
jgi:hypothetical protein